MMFCRTISQKAGQPCVSNSGRGPMGGHMWFSIVFQEVVIQLLCHGRRVAGGICRYPVCMHSTQKTPIRDF